MVNISLGYTIWKRYIRPSFPWDFCSDAIVLKSAFKIIIIVFADLKQNNCDARPFSQLWLYIFTSREWVQVLSKWLTKLQVTTYDVKSFYKLFCFVYVHNISSMKGVTFCEQITRLDCLEKIYKALYSFRFLQRWHRVKISVQNYYHCFCWFQTE